MTPQQLWIASISLGALGLVLWACALVWKLWRSARASSQVARILQARDTASTPKAATKSAMQANDAQLLNPLSINVRSSDSPQAVAANLPPPAWLQWGVAKALLADEDRKLLDQAGVGTRNGSMAYVASRMVLCVVLPLLALGVLRPGENAALMYGFLGVSLGLMLPKWFLRSRAKGRREQVVEELPLFVDLLRLLQGVGLSIDQSLQVLTKEFDQVLPVLAYELRLASELYVRGRTREQSLARLAAGFDNDDLSAICRLIAQVDQHGGAVQEPLNRFGERLREKRRLELKEKVGKTTVKMTAVMIVTLLPALLIVTGGAGFVAVLRGLSRMGGM